MEDQQPDTGDLTADAAATPTGRRRHRMPPAKKRAAPAVDSAESGAEPVSEPTPEVSSDAPEIEDSGGPELSAEPAAEAGPTATTAKPAGRWRFWRRQPSTTEDGSGVPEPSSDTVEDSVGATAAAEAVSRQPVGKRRRTAAAAAVPVSADTVETSEDPEPDAVDVETSAVAPDVAIADEPVTDETLSETEEAAEIEPQLVSHRPAGRRLKIAAVAAAALFVAGGAFAGAAVQPYLADRALVDTKQDIAETAAAAINTLWTYTPDDMAALPDRASQYLAGDFATEYQRYIDAIVSTNKQAQISNNTQVMGTAVESVTPEEATALVYTNSVSTSPVTKNIPSLRYLSYRLSMQREDTRWLITKMTAITQLDLTPRL